MIKLSIKRPIAIIMVVVCLLILGFVSLAKLPMDMMPKMDLPYVIVATRYTGAGPNEIESLVTEPIEGAVASVSGVESIMSTSSEGMSMVIIEFADGTDLDFVSIDVREAVSMVMRALPDEVNDPTVIKLNPNMMPIAFIAITDENRNKYQLATLVEDTITPRLERLNGVASVTELGSVQQEIKVVMNPDKLAGYGINASTIRGLLATENVNSVGGTVEMGDRELNVRTMGEMKSVEEMSALPIPLATGGYIRLSDVADIYIGDVERTSYARINGKEAVLITIEKQADGNTVDAMENVRKEVALIEAEYPGIDLDIAYDSAESIEEAISSVADSAVSGCILAVLVLLIFLKRIKSSIVVAVSIPVSIVTTFILVYFSGTTINMVSLGGLTLGVGMLVDNSIVVLENITRHHKMGYTAKTAALKGATQVVSAIVASTLTTIVVFLPMVFVEGMAAQLFTDMSLTVTFSLAASLFVAITIVPMMFSKLFKRKDEDENAQIVEISEFEEHELLLDEYRNTGDVSRIGIVNKFIKLFDKFMLKLYAFYEGALKYALGHQKKTVLTAILLLVVSLFSLVFTGFEMMPPSDEGQISITLEFPQDAHVDEVNRITYSAEEILLANVPEADRITASTSGRSMMSTGNSASLSITLVDANDRKKSTDEVCEDVRKLLANISGAKVSVEASSSSMGSSSSGGAVSIRIRGPELEMLETIANQVVLQISDIEGIRDPKTSLTDGKPEARVYIDRDRAMAYGLTGSQVASSINLALMGDVVTTVKNEGEEIDVRLMFPDDVNATFDQLKYVTIRTAYGENVALENVAAIEEGVGPTSISRTDQQRTVTVSAQAFGRDTGSINREVMQRVYGMHLPEGYTFDTGNSQFAQMMESFTQLGMALLLAVILVYMVMAAQFESLMQPFIVMFSMPFAFIGALLMNFFAGIPINMVTFIGFIMLMGIVVNNAIVLVDFINQLRRQKGLGLEAAILAAAPTRLRPILMTTLTTVLGLLPMALAIDESGATMQPLAVTVIGGLITSTMATLLVLPVIYHKFNLISTKEGREENRRMKAERKANRKSRRKSGKSVNDIKSVGRRFKSKANV